MARRREISVTFDLRRTTIARTVAHSESRPENPYAALMECAPHQEPEPSMEELAPLREILADVLDSVLDERERHIFDGFFVRCLSYRELGREMSLSLVHLDRLLKGDARPGKEYVGIREKLQAALVAHPTVRKYLEGST